MQTTPFTAEELEDALEYYNAGRVYADYSGRGMYGASCFGVVAASAIATLAILRATGEAMFRDRGESPFADELLDNEDVVDILLAVREDSLGRDTIVYFPGWQLATAADDEAGE